MPTTVAAMPSACRASFAISASTRVPYVLMGVIAAQHSRTSARTHAPSARGRGGPPLLELQMPARGVDLARFRDVLDVGDLAVLAADGDRLEQILGVVDRVLYLHPVAVRRQLVA